MAALSVSSVAVLKFFVSPRWGIRFDLRVLFNKVSTDTLVDTRSGIPALSPAGVAASLSTPSMQFSNNGALGPSSLAGPPLAGFRSFDARGMQTHMNVTGGVFLRF